MFNGLKLKSLIDAVGLTQKEFCSKAGVSEQSLYGYFEANANPTSKALEKMANVLKCSIDDFFDREIDCQTVNVGHHVKGNGNKVYGDIALSDCQKEIAHLKELLAEKERTIQILMNKGK